MDKTAERNHGLFRIASLTGWVAGGAIFVTGVFTFLAAHPKIHLLPKPVSTNTNTNTNTGGTSGGDLSSTGDTSGGSGSSASGGGLQAPAQLPAAGGGSAHVSSGGS